MAKKTTSKFDKLKKAAEEASKLFKDKESSAYKELVDYMVDNVYGVDYEDCKEKIDGDFEVALDILDDVAYRAIPEASWFGFRAEEMMEDRDDENDWPWCLVGLALDHTLKDENDWRELFAVFLEKDSRAYQNIMAAARANKLPLFGGVPQR